MSRFDSVSVSNTQLNKGVEDTYTKQTASSRSFLIQKGQLNHYRQRPAIINEHVETARQTQSVVASGNAVGQIFKASHDNINGLDLTLESAQGTVFDNFESYADSAALQTAWVETDANDKAELETGIVFEGTKSMKIPGGATVTLGDEWVRTITATSYTGYTATGHIYQTLPYANLKLRFFIGDGVNTKSAPIVVQSANGWETIQVSTETMTEDGGGTTDTENITKIGFRLVDRASGGEFYVDDMITTPPPGAIGVELWDMGTSLPATGVTALDDGTQYTELGDRGVNSGTVVSSVQLNLIGGKRKYHITDFVAGVALEIPGNTLLTVDNYYAIVLRYIDTDVTVYGSNTSFATNYYNNGYAFTTPDNSTAITQIGTYNDLQFTVYSTQDCWINTFLKFYNGTPGDNSTESVYIEDKNMDIVNVIAGDNVPQQSILAEFRDRYHWMPKGGKFEVNHNDDFTDDTTQINVLIGYIYEPQPVNG